MAQNSRTRNKAIVEKLRCYAVSPKTLDTAGVHAAITLLATAQDISTGIVGPDVPRVLSITGTMAGASLTGNVVIYGYDVDGNPLKQTIALNNNATVAGNLAFKSIYQISLPVRITAADTVKIGFTDAIGLPEIIPGDTVVMTTLDGAFEATRPTVVHDHALVSKCTIDPNTALATGKELCIYYIAQ